MGPKSPAGGPGAGWQGVALNLHEFSGRVQFDADEEHRDEQRSEHLAKRIPKLYAESSFAWSAPAKLATREGASPSCRLDRSRK
jgi:hypothetical protein